MRDFVFHNPTRILFGRNTILGLGREVREYAGKVLLVYGRNSIKKNGVYQQVVTSLQAAGIKIVEHSGIRPNPTLSQVREGIKTAKDNRIEAIVGVGGGSVLDSAKAIAAGIPVNHDVWKFFIAQKSIKEVLPIFCVPTLAASGSEMNGGMVLTNEEKKQKFGFANRLLFPKVSILDPMATFSVPADYTAYGAVDALAHVLEFYCTAEDENMRLQERFMEGLMTTVMENCRIALRNPEDYQARANLLWASGLALNGVTSAGIGKIGVPVHLIEHAVSALYDIPHGAGLSAIMPGWLTWLTKRNPHRPAKLAARVFKLENNDQTEQAMGAVCEMKKWFTEIKTPVNLAGLGIAAAEIPAIAENAGAQAKLWRMRDYTTERIETILELCL